MSMSLRDQLLQAGLVNEKQARDAERQQQQQLQGRQRLPKQQRGLASEQELAIRKAQQAQRVVVERATFRREVEGPALSSEKPNAEILLKLADPRTHIRRHAVQLGCRTDHPAFFHHGFENGHRLQIDSFHKENNSS